MNHIALVSVGLALLAAIVFVWFRSRAKQAKNTLPANVVASVAAAAKSSTDAPAVSREMQTVSPLRQVVALALDDANADTIAALDSAATQLLLGASQALARIGHEPRYTPSRPSLLPQLLEAVNDEEASLKALSRIISQDPALTGDLLRTANSALYRVSSNPIESIERAAAMLGTLGLRTLIAAALVKPLADDPSNAAAGRFGEVIWEHSIYSASAAEAWAARAQDCDPFSAHLLGLMHGLGDVAVQRVVRDTVTSLADANFAALVTHAVTTQGAVAARRIAANWGLSDRTQEALETQSAAAPSLEATPLALALRFGRMAGAVTLLCRHKKMEAAPAMQALQAAGFTGPNVARIWDRLVQAYVRP